MHKPISDWCYSSFSFKHKRIYSGEYKAIALWTAVTGQQCSLTEDVMQLYSWPVSCSASAKQIKEGYVLGALLSTEGAGSHGPSLNFYCRAVALLLAPWDARRPSFNRRDSKAIQKQVVETLPWESAFQTSQDEEGAGYRRLPPWGSTSKESATSSLAASF